MEQPKYEVTLTEFSTKFHTTIRADSVESLVAQTQLMLNRLMMSTVNGLREEIKAVKYIAKCRGVDVDEIRKEDDILF